MKNIIYLFMLISAVAFSCSSETTSDNNTDSQDSSQTEDASGTDEVKGGEKILEPDAVALPEPPRVTPADIVQVIFIASRTNRPELLKGLCPPSKTNDGDTDCICAMYEGYEPHKCDENSHNRVTWAEYKEYFDDGRVSAPPVINGNKAEVPFVFGVDGQKKETMKLIKEDGQWYLESF